MKAKSDTALSSSIKTSVCSTCIEIKHIAYTDRILIPGVGFLWLWWISHMVASHAYPLLPTASYSVNSTLQTKILFNPYLGLK